MVGIGLENSLEPVDFRSLPLAEMETIVSRFKARVNKALLEAPPTKELVRKAIKRAGALRCPRWLNRFDVLTVIRYGDRLADLFCECPDDLLFVLPYEASVGYQPPDRKDRINEVQVLTQGGEWKDEWGTGWGHAFGGVGAITVDHPIKDWSQLDDYLAHGMPDPHAPGRLDFAASLLSMHGESKYCVGMILQSFFERVCCLRGMQNFLSDLYLHEHEVVRLLDALSEHLIELIREWAKTDVEGIFLTEDWGSQAGLLISREMWRKYFKSYYRQIFDEIHRVGKDIIFHSCGNVTALIPDLIDLGLDVIDPIQPGAMDMNYVAREFGGHISFMGLIDDQRLDDYSPQQIRDRVRGAIETLGRPFGNGLILSPANTIMPTVPFENLEALFEVCNHQ